MKPSELRKGVLGRGLAQALRGGVLSAVGARDAACPHVRFTAKFKMGTGTCGASPRSAYFACKACAKPGANSAPCFTCAVDACRVPPIGSARPPRHLPRKFSATELNAILLAGRAKP